MIEVRPLQGYYWDTKHNRLVAFAKMVVGAPGDLLEVDSCNDATDDILNTLNGLNVLETGTIRSSAPCSNSRAHGSAAHTQSKIE